jgi:hypothetical protein
MAQHELKICSSCNNAFECKAGSITQCHCFAVSLSEDERNYLQQHYDDCICAACLLLVKNKFTNEGRQTTTNGSAA